MSKSGMKTAMTHWC